MHSKSMAFLHALYHISKGGRGEGRGLIKLHKPLPGYALMRYSGYSVLTTVILSNRSRPIVFTTGNVPRAVRTLICKSDLYKGKIRLLVHGGRVDFN